MFGWFFGNKWLKCIEEDTKRGFELVKKDILGIGGWIKHLDSEKNLLQKDIIEIKTILSTVQDEIDGLKNMISMIGQLKTNVPSKTLRGVFDKQTNKQVVETGVQTVVQTPNLSQFSVTERSILWILLNTDMKLSYDDLASMLGKEISTIRGQINRIKQKDYNLIEEITETNGKKRVFISEELKEKLLKKSKVRINKIKKQ